MGQNPAALRGIDVDLNHIPDAAMTIAVLALFADGPTRIRNVYNWRVKETDRMYAMATELTQTRRQSYHYCRFNHHPPTRGNPECMYRKPTETIEWPCASRLPHWAKQPSPLKTRTAPAKHFRITSRCLHQSATSVSAVRPYVYPTQDPTARPWSPDRPQIRLDCHWRQ